jgi:hypothetical protein
MPAIDEHASYSHGSAEEQEYNWEMHYGRMKRIGIENIVMPPIRMGERLGR